MIAKPLLNRTHPRRLRDVLIMLLLLGFSGASHAVSVSFDTDSKTVQEGTGDAVFQLIIDGCEVPAPSRENFLLVTVDSIGGDATPGSDYTGPPITVNFVNDPSGNWTTTAPVRIGVVDDPEVEDAETVGLTITELTGQVACASPQGVFQPELGNIPTTVLTITDNDVAEPPAPSEPQPILVSPPNLELQGAAGETPTTTFIITDGSPPFTVMPMNTDRGSIDIPNPGLNQTVTYGFRIPSSATDQQEFTDSIKVTASDGAEVDVPVLIIAEVDAGPPLTQDDIDDAMQDIANTQPQSSTAAAISTVCPQGIVAPRLQEDCNVMVGGALAPEEDTNQESSRALAQVTSDQASASRDASQSSVQVQGRNVGTRLTALRLGARGMTSAFNINVNGQSLPASSLADGLWKQLLSANGGAAGSDSAMDFGRFGLFINGSISLGDRDSTSNVEGFDFDTKGITLGVDYRFTDQLVMGLAAGYLNTDTDLDANGGDLDTDGYSLSLYGTFYRDSGMYLDGILSYGNNDYDQRRRISYDIGETSVRQDAKSDFDGKQLSLALGGGYSFSRDALSFGPTARLEYVKIDVDDYNERMSAPEADGGGWATHIDDQKLKSFTSQLGGEVSYAMSQNWGVLLPQAQFEWVHEFKDGGEEVTGYFLQDPSRTGFALDTDELDKNYFNLRLGVSAQFGHGRSGYFYYRKLLGYRNLDVDAFSAGLRLEF